MQAAIAALHGEAATPADTDWRQIAALYGVLLRVQPTPVVELNRAVAIAMAEGPEHGLRIVDRLEASGSLPGYHLLPASKGALLERLGRWSEAVVAYDAALAACRTPQKDGCSTRRGPPWPTAAALCRRARLQPGGRLG